MSILKPKNNQTTSKSLSQKREKGRDVAEQFNLFEYAVSRIVRSYKKEGMKCVKKNRGRKHDEERFLTTQHEKEI